MRPISALHCLLRQSLLFAPTTPPPRIPKLQVSDTAGTWPLAPGPWPELQWVQRCRLLGTRITHTALLGLPPQAVYPVVPACVASHAHAVATHTRYSPSHY
uniref:Uncharacterized protein n=1 Tax=Eutreptiella gymnastica TaxID=73025 RepID=A0A7S1N8F9_9EUGL